MERTALSSKYRGWLKFEDEVPVLTPQGQSRVDIDDFVDFENLRIVPQGMPTMHIVGSSESGTMVIEGPLRIEIEESVGRVLQINFQNENAGGNRGVTFVDGLIEVLDIVNGKVAILGSVKIAKMFLRTDQELSFNVGILEICENQIKISAKDRINIESIVDGREDRSDALMVCLIKSEGNNAPESEVTVGKIDSDIDFDLHWVALILNENDDRNCLSGRHGSLEVQRGRYLNGISVANREVALRLREDSELRNFSGFCLVEYASNATIEAALGKHFEYIGTRPGKKLAKQDNPLEGLTMRGVKVIPGHAGRNLLSELSDVRVFEPSIDKDDYFAQWRKLGYSLSGLRKKAAVNPEARKEASRLVDLAYYYKELDALVVEKCGSGAIRSRTAWVRSRAQQAISGRVERVMYSIFRLVGYGQRPIPPLLCWTAIALLTSILSVMMGANVGFLSKDFIIIFGHFLLAPFVLFKFASDPQAVGGDILSGVSLLDRQILVLLQVMIVVSFGFFVAALRNYMRSSSQK